MFRFACVCALGIGLTACATSTEPSAPAPIGKLTLGASVYVAPDGAVARVNLGKKSDDGKSISNYALAGGESLVVEIGNSSKTVQPFKSDPGNGDYRFKLGTVPPSELLIVTFKRASGTYHSSVNAVAPVAWSAPADKSTVHATDKVQLSWSHAQEGPGVVQRLEGYCSNDPDTTGKNRIEVTVPATDTSYSLDLTTLKYPAAQCGTLNLTLVHGIVGTSDAALANIGTSTGIASEVVSSVSEFDTCPNLGFCAPLRLQLTVAP